MATSFGDATPIILSLSAEYGPSRMRDTPMNRLGTMEEIAAGICFFAAPEASYITGQIMYVAGGAIG